jgi:hypothetical protein
VVFFYLATASVPRAPQFKAKAREKLPDFSEAFS